MKVRISRWTWRLLCGCLLISLFGGVEVPGAWADPPAPPVSESGIHGGLAVWVGDSASPAAWASQLGDLVDQGGWLVLALHADADVVDQVRAELIARGVYGPVSVDPLPSASPGALPLIAETVNLLVLESPGFAGEEVDRVLAPLGVSLIHDEAGWQAERKAWPEDIGVWTHYLGDASNNTVARDQRLAPPRHLQWQSGPRWSRHHDHMSSVSAVVSADGRLFGIFDEGSYLSPQLPADWKLIARDAFNGTLLWERPIAEWHCALWPLKSGPASLPRRLVAQGDRVYVTLGIRAPVRALDAATGRSLQEYEGTEDTEEILVHGDLLLALVNRTPVDPEADLAVDPEEGGSRDSRTTYSPAMARAWAGIRSPRWSHGERAILAFDAATGQRLWKHEGSVLPLTLATDGERIYFHDNRRVIALNRNGGQIAWSSDPLEVWRGLHGQGIQSWFAPSLLVEDGVVVIAGGEKMHMSYMGWGSDDIGEDTMTGLDAATGEKLWRADHPYSGYNSPQDLIAAGGRIWVGATAKGGPDGYFAGHDVRSGELRDRFPPTLDTYWFHHRCHRAKATENYILSSRTGVEFVDLQTGEWTIHHWVRGACLYGVMPANGLLYAPPHPCSCYSEALLKGLVALAPPAPSRQFAALPEEARRQRGPAYDAVEPDASSAADWPTYRGDARRSGGTGARVGGDLERVWESELGGRLTPPIAAGGRLFVADTDGHTVHALDAASGERQWRFVAGGRIDSPPTYDQGRLLFGSADGSVYCLRASDGALVWRFLAAPIDRRMVADDQVESCWPLHGSVLVQDGVATVVAGRSMYLDGGLRFYRLDAATGRVLSEKRLDDRDPETGENLQVHVRGLNMPVALTDILSSDGERLYMGSQAMDPEGNRLTLGPAGSGHPHLFAPYGFRDDSWFHRTYWVYGDRFQGGIGGFRMGQQQPAGRILVHNDSTVFGYGRQPEYFRWSSVLENHLFAAVKPGGEPRALLFENTPSLDPAGQPLTVAAWVKTDARDGTVLVRGANLNGFALILAGGKPRMLIRSQETTYQVTGDQPLTSEWTHLAGVLDAEGRLSIYVNGERAGVTEDVPYLARTPAIPMRIGHDPVNQLLPDPLTPYHGALDEVMLFHRALTAEQIARLADPAVAWESSDRQDQVLHLSFEGGSVRDRSGAGNHGDPEGARFETVPGPVGDALWFEQPRDARLVRRQSAGRSVDHLWSREAPMLVRAMALAGDRLLVAGPPDLLDEVSAFAVYGDAETQTRLERQDRAWRGERGGLFHVVDSQTGETLAEYPLDTPPVFDGLIVAGGRVFLATIDGRVLAFASP